MSFEKIGAPSLGMSGTGSGEHIALLKQVGSNKPKDSTAAAFMACLGGMNAGSPALASPNSQGSPFAAQDGNGLVC